MKWGGMAPNTGCLLLGYSCDTGFSTSALLRFGARFLLLWMESCLVHCGMFSFSKLDTRGNLNVGRSSLNKNSKNNISEDSRIGLSTAHFRGKTQVW